MSKLLASLLAVMLLAGGAFASDAVCTSDTECVDATGDPEATCSTDLAFAANSQWKTYSCVLPPGGMVAAILDPNSPSVSCGIGAGAASNATNATEADEGSAGRKLLERYLLEDASAEGPYCEISLAVANPQVQVTCTANDCAIEAGKASVTCQKTACVCDPEDCGGSSLVAGVVKSVTSTAALECDDAGKCAIKLAGFPVESVELDCTASECLAAEE